MSRAIRIGLAYAIGYGLFFAFAISLLIFGSLWRYVLRQDTRRSPLIFWPRWYSRLTTRLCYAWLLRVKIDMRDIVPMVGPGEQLICVANHPSTCSLPLFFHWVGHLGDHLRIVMKIEHIRNPFIGWTLALIQSALFINREDRESAVRKVAEERDQRTDLPTVFIVFADGTRPTSDALHQYRQQQQEKGGPKLKHLTIPKSGLLMRVLEQYPDSKVAVALHGLSVQDDGILDLRKLYGARYRLLARTVIRPTPLDEPRVRALLNTLWQEGDAFLEEERTAA